MEQFARLLVERNEHYLRATNAASQDKATFSKWNDGCITTEKAIHEFKNHNDISDDVYIDAEAFVRLMHELGFRGRKQ